MKKITIAMILALAAIACFVSCNADSIVNEELLDKVISLETATIEPIDNQTYTGSAIVPTVTVKVGETALVKDTDYTVSCSNNTNVGTATVTITGKGSYKDSKTANFTIVAKPLSSDMIATIADQTYTGSAIEPDLTVAFSSIALVKGTDYTVGCTNNTNVGTATVTITGTGNYSGTATKTFAIKYDISNATIVNIADQVWTDSEITPLPDVSYGSTPLVKDTDYTVSYQNNTDESDTAKVIITGIGNCMGTKEQTFKIRKALAFMVAGDNPNYSYYVNFESNSYSNPATDANWKSTTAELVGSAIGTATPIIGPAQGFVFYDCDADNVSNYNYDQCISSECGWRYLEAAPAKLNTTYQWGDDGKRQEFIWNIGGGENNTRVIINYFSAGITSNAATACDAYVYGGKDDWFLPSYMEVTKLWMNLMLKGLGNYDYAADKVYWSSTGGTTDFVLDTASSVGGSDTKYVRTGYCEVVPIRAF